MMRAWVPRVRLMFFIWCLSLVPVLLAMIPLLATIDGDLERQPLGKEMWHDDTYFVDLLGVLAKHEQPLTTLAVMSAVVALLLAPAVSAAAVASLRGERLIAAAARDYGRQSRLSLLGIVPFALAAALSAPALIWTNRFAERALLETQIHFTRLGARSLAAICVAIAFAWIECARVAMVRAPERISAWRAFVAGRRLLFGHFLRVMLAFVLPMIAAAALALGLLTWRAHTQWLWLGQLVPLIFAWSRGARMAAVRAL